MTEYKAEEVEQMLMMCYEAEVQKRGVKCEMDDLTKRRVRQAAKWLCGDNFKPSLMLYGRVGSGKSTLARAIVRLIGFLYDRYEMGDRRCSVTCCSALDLSRIAAEDISRIQQYKYTKLLFLDDMGMEQATVKNWGNEFSPVVELLYYRYDFQKFTIITSNLKGDQFRERYGDRIGDRMLEMFNTIEFDQTLSYRK